MDQKQMRWFTVGLIAFNMVWGLGNVVNNYSQQGISVVTSWILILALYFIPYALIVGQLGSTFKDSNGGVSSWIENTMNKRLAYYAAWTYWVVHIPYLAQKPQAILIALGWAVKGDGSFVSGMSVQMVAIISLVIFLLFLYLSTKGLSTLKVIGGLAGTAMFVMSILFILLAVGAPFMDHTMEIATQDMTNIKTYIPKFDLSYFATISMLVFAVGGAEKISPYVNQTKNPAKEFPKGMILLAIMVGVSAILGSIAMGMLFASDNIPADLMTNGAYSAFQKLGEYYGVGNFLMIVYALTNTVGQISALAFSIDAPLQVLLADADKEYVPSWLRQRTAKGTLKNGYLLTGILVSIIILLPIFGIKNMDELVKWLTNLNSVVMPLRYLWVFLAYMMLNKAFKNYQNAEYKFMKNPKWGYVIGLWCFAFTAFACILGMIPKIPYGSEGWWFQMISNIVTPIVFVALGMILPAIAKRERKN
ncbi:amino acid permease [Vagococcus xieshaowenii]|uniref:Amino acid permease n=1 Tax=Vagococcus xieshaowenii TaxID=2562451 RepID=A0A4Z0DD27_9ENTE|nr:amino acid permease [Vagococcus xieshaowenii]QCA28424.1 amino acid permease [Vagococcus xieshaowenii]TFZ42820.1 amino acid permease [Vagococcus xieshaowenii]